MVYVDHFYIASISALERTHCVCMLFNDYLIAEYLLQSSV